MRNMGRTDQGDGFVFELNGGDHCLIVSHKSGELSHTISQGWNYHIIQCML
jgi:hypothetical protein